MPQDLATSLTKFKNKLDTVSRRLSSTSPEGENLRQQILDLNSLKRGVVKLVLSKQRELRTAVERMVKVETALLNRRDFEAKLQEWLQLVNDVEDFVKHLGPFNEGEKDLELLYFEVRCVRLSKRDMSRRACLFAFSVNCVLMSPHSKKS